MNENTTAPRCPACSAALGPDHAFCPSCGTAAGPDPTARTRTSLDSGAVHTSPPSTNEPRFAPGTVIAGRYRISGLAGRGGMGEVYRADDLKLGQPVALKFLAEAVERDPDRLARFLQEVRIARQVAHPNVCRTYDVGEVGGRHFLSMEYVDGEDLASLLRRIGRLPEDKALEIARQLCAGLAAAHELGILHRDLKPSNVMIDGRGVAKIADFGLAGFAEGFTGAEIRAGTPAYMAPEQLSGQSVTVQSDIYALGLVLYELLAGRPAFDITTPIPDIARHRTEHTPESLTDLVHGLDHHVEAVILSCLAPDPAARPSSARAVALALPGGDALEAALARGETPSPELVAASGSGEAMRPALAAALAIGASLAFLATALVGGRYSLRQWVSLDKPPVVLIDRAQQIVREMGYGEPLYADPIDQAFGFDVDNSILARIAENDASAERWERLREPGVGAVNVWYRQSPSPMIPSSQEFGAFTGGPVTRWNPFPDVTGMVLVGLDPSGRLRFFAHTPRRFTPESEPVAAPDWTRPFELAGLDPASFQAVEPAYQRFMQLEHRAAWVGELPWDPGEPVRIEAGTSGGRISLWAMLHGQELESLAGQPRISGGPDADRLLFVGLVLAVIVGSSIVARRNLKRGRGDRRGTARFAGFVFALSCTRELLRTHGLFTPSGLTQLFPVLSTGLFYAALSASLYLAIEPYVRRIWPSMLVSWTRLLSRTRLSWRDPRIGRSVLSGLATGSAVGLTHPLTYHLFSWVEGAPGWPLHGAWQGLLGTGFALAELAEWLNLALIQGFVFVFLLVVGRQLTGRSWAAVLLAALAWLSFTEPVRESWVDTAVQIAIQSFWSAVFLFVMLRHGVLALIVALFVVHMGRLAYVTDLSAWHARPAIYTMLTIGALAAYGWWAASAPRHPLLRD